MGFKAQFALALSSLTKPRVFFGQSAFDNKAMEGVSENLLAIFGPGLRRETRTPVGAFVDSVLGRDAAQEKADADDVVVQVALQSTVEDLGSEIGLPSLVRPHRHASPVSFPTFAATAIVSKLFQGHTGLQRVGHC